MTSHSNKRSPRLRRRAHDNNCRDLLSSLKRAQGSVGELTTSSVVTFHPSAKSPRLRRRAHDINCRDLLSFQKGAQGSYREHVTSIAVISCTFKKELKAHSESSRHQVSSPPKQASKSPRLNEGAHDIKCRDLLSIRKRA